MKLPASSRLVASGLLIGAAILTGRLFAPLERPSDRAAPSGPAAVSTDARTNRPGPPSPATRSRADAQRVLARATSEQLQLVIENRSETWREGDQSLDLANLLEAWAQRDGAAALESFTRGDHAEPFSRWALEHLLAGWTKADPGAALAWASPSNPTYPERHSGLFLTALRLAAHGGDASPALNAAATLPPGPLRASAADAIASEIVRGKTVTEASDWYGSVSSPLKTALLRPLTRRLAESAPADAATWAASLPERESRFEAVPEIARLWSRVDPTAAADWARDLPEADLRSNALAEVIKSWAPQDAEAAGQWLGALPAGFESDRALALYVNEISRTHPGIASQWLTLIDDARARRSAALRVNFHWNRVDPAAAARWRSGTPIATPAQ